MIDFQAHKGVSTENPENTMPAFKAAIEQGYNIIELDVSVTKDMKFVLLHDSTINRTARNNDGTEISERIEIGEITYAEALNFDFGIVVSEKFRGTSIPLFEDVLKLASENGIYLKIDNKYQRFSPEQKEAFFKLIKPYERTACLTCSDMDEIKRAADFFPRMCFHYDGAVTKEKLEHLSEIVPKDRLTVWMPYKNSATSWVNVPFADSETAGLIKKYAKLGIWILSKYSEFEDAVSLGADVIETNGQIKPENNNPNISPI
ncbi:MAG: glycerophosphodiester phosphodiesterase family protein [Firmicutes bacterium]|nr:glycerophosphodiester phosphodiesterase family protein [Bacillota bacterium]